MFFLAAFITLFSLPTRWPGLLFHSQIRNYYFFCSSTDTKQERNFPCACVYCLFPQKKYLAAHAFVYFMLYLTVWKTTAWTFNKIYPFSAPHNNDSHLVCEVLTTRGWVDNNKYLHFLGNYSFKKVNM